MASLNRRYALLSRAPNWALSIRHVPGHGPLNAKVMLIGQAPGRNEDVQLKPFVGISGRLLDRLISSAGLKREDLYITSVVQFFPPKNRVPTDLEIERCRPLLEEQIEIIRPQLIVLLGAVASRTIIGTKSIMQSHGRPVEKDGTTYFPTLHPAAAVRLKKNVPLIESDFRNLSKLIGKANARNKNQ